MSVEPGGCRHCGIPERQHYQQWTEAAGWHQWVQPEQPQILARMKARRAARATNSPKDKPMSMPPALATIAALHTLLTDRPELAALPIRWSVEPGGDLHASPSYRAVGSHDAVRALAVAIGGDTDEYTVDSQETGETLAVVAICLGEFAGFPVYSYGYELALVEETVVVGGAR